jgi:hypothetical protein
VGGSFKWSRVGFGAAAVLWLVAAGAAALSSQPVGQNGAYRAGAVVGGILLPLLVAVVIRFLYVKVIRLRSGLPVTSGWLFVLAFCFAWVAMLGGGQTAGAGTLEECLRDLPAGFRSALSIEEQRAITDAELLEVARPICREMVSTDASPEDAGQVFRENPELWYPLCHLSYEVQYRLLGPLLSYVSKKERRHFKTRACRLSVRYLRDDSSVDTDSLLAAHPTFYAPFCAAGVQKNLGADPETARRFTRGQIARIAKRGCKVAMTRGVIDMTGPGGLANPKVDQQEFVAILQRAALQVTARD